MSASNEEEPPEYKVFNEFNNAMKMGQPTKLTDNNGNNVPYYDDLLAIKNYYENHKDNESLFEHSVKKDIFNVFKWLINESHELTSEIIQLKT